MTPKQDGGKINPIINQQKGMANMNIEFVHEANRGELMALLGGLEESKRKEVLEYIEALEESQRNLIGVVNKLAAFIKG